MGLSRKRDNSLIWPGFVDAVTVLLMVLMFVLTIFTVMQSVLRETITSQDNELSALAGQVTELADALGLERKQADDLKTQVGDLSASLTQAEAEDVRQSSLIATLSGQLSARQADLAAAQGRITSFEAQVATLLAERDSARGEASTLSASLTDLQDAQSRMITRNEALDLALAKARDEIDAQTEAARLAAARREALDLLIAELRSRAANSELSLSAALANLQTAQARAERLSANGATLTAKLTEAERQLLAERAAADANASGLSADLSDAERRLLAERAAAVAIKARLAGAQADLSDAERIRLTDLAAAEALRERLKTSDDELTAMTLALEEQRKRAEETLTLLAAAEAKAGAAANTSQVRSVLLEAARKVLSRKDEELVTTARRMALLNEQIAALRGQLGALQAVLDASAAKDVAANVQLEALGSQLNSALAQVAAEQKRRADLEAQEVARLKVEKLDLERYRSEFFGQLSTLLAGRDGVRVVGDRFVFSSEVLFNPGAADLAPEGQAQIASVVEILNDISGEIPDGIDWIIRVDGHTDNVPLSGTGAFADNWELSQARALSVVRYMQDQLGVPPQRLAATGFGEYQPVAAGDDSEARALNRRIELKMTER